MPQREVFRTDAKIRFCCSFNPIYTATEGSYIEVAIEDFILGIFGLNGDRKFHFFKLAFDSGLCGFVVGGLASFRISDVFCTHHQNVLHILLTNGGTTLDLSAHSVGDECTCCSNKVNTTMLVEARVFCRQCCIHDMGGNLFEVDDFTVLCIERSQQHIRTVSGFGIDVGLLSKIVKFEVFRQVVKDTEDTIGGHARDRNCRCDGSRDKNSSDGTHSDECKHSPE